MATVVAGEAMARAVVAMARVAMARVVGDLEEESLEAGVKAGNSAVAERLGFGTARAHASGSVAALCL